MSIYNCEKYIRLILGNDGSCNLNGEESAMGFPVAGESNAFAVEVTFPDGYKDFAKSAYLSIGDKNYRIILVENREKEGTGVYYFLLPSDINKGGALGITVAASKDSSDKDGETLVKWKPYYITVLDAPVTYELKLPSHYDLLQYLQEKAESAYEYAERLDGETIKKALLDFIPQSFSEGHSGEGRFIQFDGKVPSTGEVANKQVKLGVVTNNKNGDMTPEMLEKLNHSNDVVNKLGESAITDVKITNDNGIVLNFSNKDLKTGDTENILVAIPMATPTTNGLLSADDKRRLNNMVVLDDSGHISDSYLPSYVDDVLEFDTYSTLPAVGEKGKIYVALDTNKTYRWSGSSYVEIGASLALGETSGTAYRGDRGKIAYDHSQIMGNPHGLTKADLGLENAVTRDEVLNMISGNKSNSLLYRHRILLSGSNTSISNAFTLGLIDVYTASSEKITTVAGVAAALGIKGSSVLVPVSGCAENGSGHTVLCTEAWVSSTSISLHGMYFGHSSGNCIMQRVTTVVESVTDEVYPLNETWEIVFEGSQEFTSSDSFYVPDLQSTDTVQITAEVIFYYFFGRDPESEHDINVDEESEYITFDFTKEPLPYTVQHYEGANVEFQHNGKYINFKFNEYFNQFKGINIIVTPYKVIIKEIRRKV